MSQGPRRTQAAACHQLLSVPLILPSDPPTGLPPSLHSKNLTLPSFRLPRCSLFPLPSLPFQLPPLPLPNPGPNPSFTSVYWLRQPTPSNNQEWNPCPRHWKQGVQPLGPPSDGPNGAADVSPLWLEHMGFPVVCLSRPNPCHCFSSSFISLGSREGPAWPHVLPLPFHPAPCPSGSSVPQPQGHPHPLVSGPVQGTCSVRMPTPPVFVFLTVHDVSLSHRTGTSPFAGC